MGVESYDIAANVSLDVVFVVWVTTSKFHLLRLAKYISIYLYKIVLFCRIHALKDEMFIRHSLQRQSAKLQHAAVTYVVSNYNTNVNFCMNRRLFLLSEGGWPFPFDFSL